MLKAVLFDLDDTLIDWSEISTDWESMQLPHIEGVFEYICQHHPLESKARFISEFQARTMNAWSESSNSLRAPNLANVLLDTAHALGLPEGRLTARACMEAYRWGLIQGARLFPETTRVLDDLLANNVRLGLITNAYQPMWARDIELEALGLSPYFQDCRISAADHGYLKPHRSIFESALKILGATPDEAVFVGDDLYADVNGAQQAGIYAVLRVSRRRKVILDGSVKPDDVANRLDDLLLILDREFSGWRA